MLRTQQRFCCLRVGRSHQRIEDLLRAPRQARICWARGSGSANSASVADPAAYPPEPATAVSNSPLGFIGRQQSKLENLDRTPCRIRLPACAGSPLRIFLIERFVL